MGGGVGAARPRLHVLLGAVDAWLVDSLEHEGYTGDLDPIFAKGQIITGAAMLLGTVAGAFIAQLTELGVPYLVRGGLQLIGFVLAFAIMREVAFTPSKEARDPGPRARPRRG